MFQRVTRVKSQMNVVFRPGGKVFYGWWIVAACAGVGLLRALTWSKSYGGFTLYLQEDFGWSMSILSLTFALTHIEVLGPLQGWLADKYGPRQLLIIGMLSHACGLFIFSQVNSITTYVVACLVIGLGSSFRPETVAIVNWFDLHRSKAIALTHMGRSIGGLYVPFVIIGLEAIGWRDMSMFFGVMILTLGLPLASVVRHRPEDFNEVPDGISTRNNYCDNESESAKDCVAQSSLTWQQAVREHSFWRISVGHGLSVLTVSAVNAHLVPHLTLILRYTPVEAGFVYALMSGMRVCGLFLGGYLGDIYEKRFLCTICMLGHCFGLLVVTYATTFGWVFAFTLIYGISWGVRGPMVVAMRADYFGTKSFGVISGIAETVLSIAAFVAPIFCGVLYDLYGNYTVAFTVIAFCSLGGGLCFWFARPPTPGN